MCKRAVSEVVGGELIRTLDDTWDGSAVAAIHQVTKVRCDWRDRLVELEVRDGAVLRYIMRLDPTETVDVAA